MKQSGALGPATGQVTGWDPDRELMRARRIRQMEWAAVPAYTFGYLAFVPFLYIAIARRRWWDWAVFGLYLAAGILLMALTPHPNAVGPWLVVVALVGAVHALIELRPGSALAASRDIYPASEVDRARRVIAWHGAEMVLGRDAEGSLLFAGDPDVSPRHAILRRGPHAACVVDDLGSAAGTFANGMRIKGPTRLYSGDELRLGASRLRIQGDPLPAVVASVEGVPRQADAPGTVPGALRIDHAELRTQVPVFGAMGGTAQPGWLVLTETGEIRFYDQKLPADMTKPPAFSAKSPREFVRKIGKIQVWAQFGEMKCLVWFDGERVPERTAARIEEQADQADQLGDIVGQGSAALWHMVSFAAAAHIAGGVVAIIAKTLELRRIARNSKPRAAAREAWYPVLLGRQPWPMINAAPELALEIPWLTGRSAPWTVDEVLSHIGQAEPGAATVAAALCDWVTAHSHLQIAGGTGAIYPSLTVYADFGRGSSRRIGILSLHSNPRGGPGVLEVRVGQMCSVPPYDSDAARASFTADLHALGITRLADAPVRKRPNIPLHDLADGRAERLLRLIDRWIDDVQAHAAPHIAKV